MEKAIQYDMLAEKKSEHFKGSTGNSPY